MRSLSCCFSSPKEPKPAQPSQDPECAHKVTHHGIGSGNCERRTDLVTWERILPQSVYYHKVEKNIIVLFNTRDAIDPQSVIMKHHHGETILAIPHNKNKIYYDLKLEGHKIWGHFLRTHPASRNNRNKQLAAFGPELATLITSQHLPISFSLSSSYSSPISLVFQFLVQSTNRQSVLLVLVHAASSASIPSQHRNISGTS